MSQWKFLKASTVYLYPSANADDGGDVNSEYNIAGITDKLIQRNFVVCKDTSKNPLPLKINITIKDSRNYLSILCGEAIINGYDVKLDPSTVQEKSNYAIYQKEIIASDIEGYSDYFNDWKSKYSKWVNLKEHPVRGETPTVPLLYVVVKLLRDTTGNLRGDLLNLETSGEVVNYCRGAAWGVVTEDNLAKLDAPYVVLGSFMPGQGSSNTKLVVRGEDDYHHYNDDLRYTYINIDSIFVDNSTNLQQYVVNKIKESSDNQNTLTYYETDPNNPNGPRKKFLEITVRDGKVEVKRYEYVGDSNGTPQYDSNGDYLVKLIESNSSDVNTIDKTYNIDNLQKRSHPASSAVLTDNIPQEVNDTAETISREDGVRETFLYTEGLSRDSGEGSYILPPTLNSEGRISIPESVTHNGRSRLLARADHHHHAIYLRSSSAEALDPRSEFYKDGANKPDHFSYDTSQHAESGTQYQYVKRLSVIQKLATSRLKVGSPDTSKSSDFNVWEDGDITSKYINTYSNESEGGTPSIFISKRTSATDESHKDSQRQDSDAYHGKVNLEVNGTVRADKVYNAVWNDYAELYKKDSSDIEVEPGTVICKVKGKDTYAPSTYDSSKLVVGVVSDSYGHIVGGDPDKSLEENLKLYYPVALAGRVYVKVAPRCIIEEGDLLSVSMYEGRVVACSSPTSGTVVGKALESSDYENPKDKILMQVMLK